VIDNSTSNLIKAIEKVVKDLTKILNNLNEKKR